METPALPETTCNNVLLVDDEEIDLFINEKVISSTNFSKKIHKAPSGRLGIEFLKNVKDKSELPEIIFLDLNMPLMNGFDFLAAFEKLPSDITSHCRIVILSSSNSDQDRSKALKHSTVMKYMCKPINNYLLGELKKISDAKKGQNPINEIIKNFKIIQNGKTESQDAA